MNNNILRNRNYRALYKKVIWHVYEAYARNIYDVYYETISNKHYRKTSK